MSKFKWDGSYLGEFSPSVIVASTKTKMGRYCRIQIAETVGLGLLRSTKTTFPSLIDELKPIFGLLKLGTHTLKLDGILFLFTRIPTIGDGIIIEDILLRDLKIKPEYNLVFRQQIQEILCFRDILAIPGTHESGIYVRVPVTGIPYPLSARENGMNFYPRRAIISNVMMKKWFSETPISEVLFRMLRIDPHDLDMTAFLAKYRSSIEGVIYRIDKDAIWTSVFILERIMSRILPAL